MANKKKCRHCDEYGSPQGGVTVPLGWFCSMEHVVAHSKDKAAKKRQSEFKKETARLKKNSRDSDRSYHLKEAQKWFNKFIRLRDFDNPCISCGRNHQGQYHAGHYRSVGSNPELRFNELNCHKQCAPCNNHMSGNIENYRPALIDKIGLDKVEWIEGPHKPLKPSIQDLKDLISAYKKKCKELEKDKG